MVFLGAISIIPNRQFRDIPKRLYHRNMETSTQTGPTSQRPYRICNAKSLGIALRDARQPAGLTMALASASPVIHVRDSQVRGVDQEQRQGLDAVKNIASVKWTSATSGDKLCVNIASKLGTDTPTAKITVTRGRNRCRSALKRSHSRSTDFVSFCGTYALHPPITRLSRLGPLDLCV